MPIITVKVAPFHPVADLERKVAGMVADASTRILRKRPEVTAVVVESVDAKSWFAGGPALHAQEKSSFWLEIRVTENSKDEKAAFITAVFKEMGKLLGDLHEESYIHVHEVRSDAYGYGGQTQERRYIEHRLQTTSI